MNNLQTKSTSSLYYLLWHDVMERLDILLLESRHVQINIIHSLREPRLYSILGHEEKYLWPPNVEHKNNTHVKENLWWEEWQKFLTNNISLESFAEKTVLLFPGLDEIQNTDSNKKSKDFDEDVSLLMCRLNVIRENHQWNSGQYSDYSSLKKLQLLKLHIFKDKMFFCKYGLEAFSPSANDRDNGSEHSSFRFSKLLLLRNGILERIIGYIERIGDHQAHFSKTHDIGIQDHPRPTMERRREQGIFSSHLTTYCVDKSRELNLLVDSFRAIPSHQKQWRKEDVIHRWKHSYTSMSETFLNEFHKSDVLGSRDKVFQSYINSSYWMPDRPDMISILAHECAHSVVRSRYDNLSPQAVSETEDCFCDLIRRLEHCIATYEVEDRLSAKKILNEMVVDLMAITVDGAAYLYSIFLEILGHDTANVFTWGDSEEIELELIEHLKGAAGVHVIDYSWYIRLSVLIHWYEGLCFKSRLIADNDYNSRLGRRLADGCKEILENQLDYLEFLTISERKVGRYIRSLTNQLRLLIENSKALKVARNWRIRREAVFSKENNEREKKCVIHEFPRSSRPLGSLSQYMAILSCIHSIPEDKTSNSNYFKEVYELNFHDIDRYTHKNLIANGSANLNAKFIQYLSDIPWVRSFLKGHDEVRKEPNIFDKEVWKQRIINLHNNTSMGRESYQLALDFHIDSSETKYSRLLDIKRVVREWLSIEYDKLMECCNSPLSDNALIESAIRLKRLIKIQEWLGVSFSTIETKLSMKTCEYDESKHKEKEINNKRDADNSEPRLNDILTFYTRKIFDSGKIPEVIVELLDKRIIELNTICAAKEVLDNENNHYGDWGVSELKNLKRSIDNKIIELEMSDKSLDYFLDTHLEVYKNISYFKERLNVIFEQYDCSDVNDKTFSESSAEEECNSLLNDIQFSSVGSWNNKYKKKLKSTLSNFKKNSTTIQEAKSGIIKWSENEEKITPEISDILKQRIELYKLKLIYGIECSKRACPGKFSSDDIEFKDLEFLAKKYCVVELMSVEARNSQTVFQHNYLERLRGQKIQDLLKILDEFYLPNWGAELGQDRDLETLKRYLGNYGHLSTDNQTGNANKMRLLAKVFTNKNLEYENSIYMFTRASVIGSYDSIAPRPSEIDDHNNNVSSFEKVHLLGRFDALNITKVTPLYRCNLPKLSERCGKGFIYPSFFVRREFSVPVFLEDMIKSKGVICSENSKSEINETSNQVIAIISVVLARPSTRLDFLVRILKEIENGGSLTNTDDKAQYLVGIGRYFEEKDRIFLSDGWGDLILVFCGNAEDRLKKIFEVQNILFQDFHVDRTEIILTTKCVNHAATYKGSEEEQKSGQNPFRLSMHVRLMEDRTLSTMNEGYLEKFRDNIKKLEKDNLNSDYCLCYTLTRTPGRMDYSFRFRVINKRDDQAQVEGRLVPVNEKNVYRDVLTLVDHEEVERIQTNIGLVAACDRNT